MPVNIIRLYKSGELNTLLHAILSIISIRLLVWLRLEDFFRLHRRSENELLLDAKPFGTP